MGKTHSRAPADWLGLAAAPTFAAMALWTGLLGDHRSDMLCSITQDASPLSGMVLMYLLMAAFHSAPWLRMTSRRRHSALGAARPVSEPSLYTRHSRPCGGNPSQRRKGGGVARQRAIFLTCELNQGFPPQGRE
jgi:hypothetical protein